ncbi:MAG: hypothetical protein AAF633_29000, partial [Chloroflexota bacterium]
DGEVHSASTLPFGEPIIQLNADAIHFHWDMSAALNAEEDSKFIALTANSDEFQLSEEPGQPMLPVQSHLIVVPEGGTPKLELIHHTAKIEPLPDDLFLAPFPEAVLRDAAGRPLGGKYGDPLPIHQSAPMPDFDPVEIEFIGEMGGLQLARLSFYPTRPTDGGQSIEITTELKVTLTFDGFSMPSALDARVKSGLYSSSPMATLLEHKVVNPNHILSVRRSADVSTIRAVENETADYYLAVDQSGLVQLTYESLSANGVVLSGRDPARWGLTRSGETIPMIWDGDGDASFEAGERLIFFAPEWHSRWTHEAVFGLTYEASTASRVFSAAPIGGLPEGVVTVTETLESDNYYTPSSFYGSVPLGRDGDYWIWGELRRPGSDTFSHTLELADAVDPAQPSELSVWMIGYTNLAVDPDHVVRISVDETVVGTMSWDGLNAAADTFALPAGLLTSSSEITFKLEGEAS